MDDVQSTLLRELDTYLAFFKRRQEVEQDYVESLKKLSIKAAQGDRGLDDELHSQVPTSWRKAWLAVRNAVEDEARAHRITAEGLDRLVNNLSTFRDNRDRIRRRIREDLRSTASEHAEYKAVVVRLRKTYERRVEELQHHEEAEALKEEDRPSSAKSPGIAGGSKEDGWPPEHWSRAIAGENPAQLRKRSDSAASSRGALSDDSPPHSVLSPSLAPVFVSGATSSSGAPPSGPYRDPPTGKQNVFEALAKRDWSGEKHRVNSIVRAVGSLAKGTDPAVALGPSKARNRQYGSKLKREAENADREYRSGIFALETLRMQKLRVQTSARESLKEFVLELSSTLKTIFEQRVTDQVGLGHSQIAIGEHVKPELDKMDARRDSDEFFVGVRDQAPPEPPVYYVNAFVGECKSLLFGVGLQDYHAKHPSLLVPLVVQRCVEHVDAYGLEMEGIYRVPGKLATIQQIVTRMEKDEPAFHFGPNDDPPAVAGVLKLYLRQLPIPLCPYPAADRKAFTADYSTAPDFAVAALTRRLRRLSPPQQATLKILCEHLARIAAHEHVNKMNTSNLALIFSTVVFGEDESATLETALQGTRDIVMEVLIKQNIPLFEGLPAEPLSLSRSRRPSGNVVSPTAGSASTTAPTGHPFQLPGSDSMPPLSPSAAPSSTGTPISVQSLRDPPTSSAMRDAGSLDSVYALYQRATAPGVLPRDSHSPGPTSTSFAPNSPVVTPVVTSPSAPTIQRSGTLPTSQFTILTSPLSRSPPLSHSAPPLSPANEQNFELNTSDLASSPLSLQDPTMEEHGPPALPPQPPLKDHSLETPPPPLSAAGGRHIPPTPPMDA
ncbi:hypothetical protein JCM11641_002692 [Rhodosporidiobolus odoratus]